MGSPTFADVKAVLDAIIETWAAGHGAPPDLEGVHGPSFSWATRDALLAASARGQPLIQPDVIGVKDAGATANIILDLTKGLTVGARRFPRMPLGGLDSNNGEYFKIDAPEIQTLIAWIEAGCPA